MRINKDTRGYSYFDIYPNQEGQTDVSVNYPGTIRAFHLHKNKDECWFAITGEFKVVVTEPLEIYYLTRGESIDIKRGRWHGFQVLGNEVGTMIEYATAKHNLKIPDDFRKPWNEFDNWEIEKK